MRCMHGLDCSNATRVGGGHYNDADPVGCRVDRNEKDATTMIILQIETSIRIDHTYSK